MAVEEYNTMASYYDIVLEPVLWNMRRKIVNISGIHPGLNVLEVACGTGMQGTRFRKAGAEYTGVDLSPAMLKVANKHHINCIHADGTELPLEADSFDLSTITLALHEVDPDIRRDITGEMIRVTKKGGSVIIVDYTLTSSGSLYARVGNKSIHYIEKLVGGNHYRNYLSFMKEGGLLAYLKTLDLTITERHFIFGGNIGIIKLRKNV